jgi:uncharacterized protein YqgV (UPF0045/DUF77 family)
LKKNRKIKLEATADAATTLMEKEFDARFDTLLHIHEFVISENQLYVIVG